MPKVPGVEFYTKNKEAREKKEKRGGLWSVVCNPERVTLISYSVCVCGLDHMLSKDLIPYLQD